MSKIKEELNQLIPIAFRARSVLTNVNGKWCNCLTVINGYPENEAPDRRPDLNYKNHRLIERWITQNDLINVMENIGEIGSFPGEEFIIFGDNFQFNQCYFICSNNHLSSLPGYYFESTRSGISPSGETSGFLHPQNPFYKDAYSAIKVWCEIEDYHGSNDARNQTVIVFVPETRSRFSKIKMDDGKVSIDVFSSQGNANRLLVKGEITGELSGLEVNEEVRDDALLIPIIPEKIRDIEIYLIDSSNRIYDYHFENYYYSSSSIRLFSDDSNNTLGEGELLDKIRNGESDRTEFKPYLKENDMNKILEVVETVIAFSNTNGGRVYIGVNNYCEPVGVEKDIMNSSRRQGVSYESEIEKYKGWIMSKIRDKVQGSVNISINHAPVCGHTIIIVTVDESNEKPICTSDSRCIFIRKGSSNVKPDPRTELPNLVLRRSDPFS